MKMFKINSSIKKKVFRSLARPAQVLVTACGRMSGRLASFVGISLTYAGLTILAHMVHYTLANAWEIGFFVGT